MNRKRANSALIAAAMAVCLAIPHVAGASSGDVIRDCSKDGALSGHYSQGELQGALKGLPSDLDEYTDCRSVIRQASLSKAGGKGDGPASAAINKIDSNAPPTGSEQDRVNKATKSGAAVSINGEQVTPGAGGFLAAAFDNHLPTLLIALLVMFAMAVLAGSALAASHRWPATTSAIAQGAARPFKAVGRGVRRGVSRFRG